MQRVTTIRQVLAVARGERRQVKRRVVVAIPILTPYGQPVNADG
jgi:hypothetical protein